MRCACQHYELCNWGKTHLGNKWVATAKCWALKTETQWLREAYGNIMYQYSKITSGIAVDFDNTEGCISTSTLLSDPWVQ